MDGLWIGVLVAGLVNLLILSAIIRNAVRAALRDHQEWLDKRSAPHLQQPAKKLK